MGRYTKAFFGALGAGAAAYIAASADGVLTGLEVGEILGATLVALGLVWRLPLTNYLKPIATTVVSVAGALVVALDDSVIDGNEWYAIVGIVFAALGTYVFPNAQRSDELPA